VADDGVYGVVVDVVDVVVDGGSNEGDTLVSRMVGVAWRLRPAVSSKTKIPQS